MDAGGPGAAAVSEEAPRPLSLAALRTLARRNLRRQRPVCLCGLGCAATDGEVADRAPPFHVAQPHLPDPRRTATSRRVAGTSRASLTKSHRPPSPRISNWHA